MNDPKKLLVITHPVLSNIEDDEIVGIHSSARLFGARLRLAVGLCYAGTVALFASGT